MLKGITLVKNEEKREENLRISVAMFAYNEEGYIGYALHSKGKQMHYVGGGSDELVDKVDLMSILKKEMLEEGGYEINHIVKLPNVSTITPYPGKSIKSKARAKIFTGKLVHNYLVKIGKRNISRYAFDGESIDLIFDKTIDEQIEFFERKEPCGYTLNNLKALKYIKDNFKVRYGLK